MKSRDIPANTSSVGKPLRAPCVRGALLVSVLWAWREVLWINGGLAIYHLFPPSWGVVDSPVPRLMGSFSLSSLVLYLLICARRPVIRGKCEILFLRGFEHEITAKLRSRVLPALGCYGRVLALGNPKVFQDHQQIGVLPADLVGDLDEQRRCRDNWRDEFDELLGRADLVVIDVSELTEFVRWELEQCLNALPPQRIIPIVEFSPYIRDRMSSVYYIYMDHGLEPEAVDWIAYPSRRWIPLRFWKLWPFKFERLLASRMNRIPSGIRGRNP